MKKEAFQVDAIPTKRLYSSIIADYDINRSLSELIDNALDLWVKAGKTTHLTITIELEKNQQYINVLDNAGGIRKEEINNIVAPGETGNSPEDETIGIFGVGSKRAVVALSQDITITTRFKNEQTYQLEYDDAWLGDNSNWQLMVYTVDNIPEGTTTIRLQRLRTFIDDETISRFKDHLQATYAYFLKDSKVEIKVNSEIINPIFFENWAYPPKYPPHKYKSIIKSEDGGQVQVAITAGLINESSPSSGDYGVFFYCNGRLIARALKNYHVGFVKGLAGQPHPSISLMRAVVLLQGPAQLMPWNSSKSGINPNHKTFLSLRNFVVQIVKEFSSLSRRWEGRWDEEVFKHDSGTITEIQIPNLPNAKKSYLPPLPKSRIRPSELIVKLNRVIAKDKPWTSGLYESIAAIEIISKQQFREKNRINLIILDSTLEIAFKEYLVNESGQPYNDTKLLGLFKNRVDVQKEVQKFVQLPQSFWQKIDYYYAIRCKLVHERATVGISDEQVAEYRQVVQDVLEQLFKLKFI